MNDSTSEPTQPQLTKVCTKCGETKPATTEYFRVKSEAKDGLTTICKDCFRVFFRNDRQTNPDRYKRINRKYLDQNRDKVLARQKERYQKNKKSRTERNRQNYKKNKAKIRESQKRYAEANKEKTTTYQKEYYKANKEKLAAANKGYYEANKEQILEKAKENRPKWRAANPEKDKAQQHRRIARKRGLPDSFSPEDWEKAVAYFGGCCAVCGRPPGLLHVLAADHWIPLSSPDCTGTIPTNIVPVCHGDGGCNNSKHNKDALVWLIKKFGEAQGKAIAAKIQAYFDSLA